MERVNIFNTYLERIAINISRLLKYTVIKSRIDIDEENTFLIQ